MSQLAQETLAGIPARAADVIVVGAGTSGLYDAYKLQQSGVSCIVLEASGRVGGPTSPTNNHFNSELHPRTHALAAEFGLLDESRPRQGKTILEGFEPFEHHEQPAATNDFAVSESSKQIAAALAQRLSPGTIRLDRKVTHVEATSGTTCRIYTESGDVFVGSKVALAGSLPMCGTLQITPPIAMAAGWEAMRDEQGFSTSVDIVFDHPWWQQRGLSGHAQGLTGPISQVRPPGACGCGLMSDEERETLIMQHLDTIFGGDNKIPRAVQIIEKDENPLVSGQQALNVAWKKVERAAGERVWAAPPEGQYSLCRCGHEHRVQGACGGRTGGWRKSSG
ncbi:hypothetical protein MY10362_004027 [Beauveria mimosiformis]